MRKISLVLAAVLFMFFLNIQNSYAKKPCEPDASAVERGISISAPKTLTEEPDQFKTKKKKKAKVETVSYIASGIVSNNSNCSIKNSEVSAKIFYMEKVVDSKKIKSGKIGPFGSKKIDVKGKFKGKYLNVPVKETDFRVELSVVDVK